MNTPIPPAAAWPFAVQQVRMVRVNSYFLAELQAPPSTPMDPIEQWLRLGAARLPDQPTDVEYVNIPCTPKQAHEMLMFIQEAWDFPNCNWMELELLAEIIPVAHEYRK